MRDDVTQGPHPGDIGLATGQRHGDACSVGRCLQGIGAAELLRAAFEKGSKAFLASPGAPTRARPGAPGSPPRSRPAEPHQYAWLMSQIPVVTAVAPGPRLPKRLLRTSEVAISVFLFGGLLSKNSQYTANCFGSIQIRWQSVPWVHVVLKVLCRIIRQPNLSLIVFPDECL